MTNINDIKQMSKQQACDYSIKKVLEQQGPCVNDDGVCVYTNGKKRCSIGFLLPVKCTLISRTSKDRDTPIDLVISSGKADHIPAIIKDNVQVFQRLQNLHDTYNNTSRLKEEIMKLGELGIKVNKKPYTEWLKFCQKKYNKN